MSASRCPAPPSPTLTNMAVDVPDWHAIGRRSARDLLGGVLSAWYQSELQHQHAHRRGQLPRLGVRSSGGVYFCERLLVLTLLATGAYYEGYIHMVGTVMDIYRYHPGLGTFFD